jgi:hypothetical protein
MKRLRTIWTGLVVLTQAVLTRFRSPTATPVHQLVTVSRVEDLPDEPKPSTLYVAGEGENVWAAAMLCPCGCGDLIQLNLLQSIRPRWKAEEHEDHSASLRPSVWRRKGCNSHFILRRGEIVWCQPGSPPSYEPVIDRLI